MRECRDLPTPVQIIFALDGFFLFFYYPQDINENYYLTTYNSLATKQSALELSNYRTVFLDCPIRSHCWIHPRALLDSLVLGSASCEDFAACGQDVDGP